MFSKNRNNKPANKAAGNNENPEAVKKLICMGPTPFGNYRIIACLNNEQEIHYYMDGRGNEYTPPKHKPGQLIDQVQARKEWDWAKKNWTVNNTPFLLMVNDKHKQLRQNAFKALGQVRANRQTSVAIKIINAKTENATLGDIPALQAVREKITSDDSQVTKFKKRFEKAKKTA